MDYTMDDYRKSVEFCAKKHLDNMLHNEGPEHAKIIFESLFKYSKSYIRIAAKDLANREVVNTEEYVSAMSTFLKNSDTRLDILLSDFNPEVIGIEKNINFFLLLANSEAYKRGRVRIKTTDGKSFKMNGEPVHFCTADGQAYRLERDIINRIAHGNFNDTKTTGKLEAAFDKAFESFSNEVKLETYFA